MFAATSQTPSSRPGHPGGIPKKTPETIAEIAAAHPGETVEVWFEDEARFGQKGTLTTVWADTGSRPTAPKQGGFKSLHIFTTVCPATGRAEGLICERLNTAIVQIFLDQLSATIPAGTHVALIWDNAGYHTSKALRPPKNITLVRLPPYSPELNPAENLWHYLRCHYWSNRTYQDLDAVEDAAVEGWRKACLNTEIIKYVCAWPYLEKRG